MKKLFLLFVMVILLYLFFLFLDKSLATEFSPSFPESAVIKIEPMLTPPVFEISEQEETLLKLKLAVDDTFSKDNSSEESEADSILATLKESVPLFLAPPLIVKQDPVSIKKSLFALQKSKRVKAKIGITKKVTKKRLPKKRLPKKQKIIKKVIVKKQVHLAQVKVEVTPSVKSKKREILLGEQDDVYYLSEEERKNFKNLEVLFVSKPFVLEEEQQMKSPEPYKGVQQEVKLEDLAFVETLGVVNVSTPSIYQNELIKR